MVTQITAEAKFNGVNAVTVAGQCWARPGVPAAGNLVDVSSDWGATAHTQSTQSFGAFVATLAGSAGNVGQKVTIQADAATAYAFVKPRA
jgi:hypothetical protein